MNIHILSVWTSSQQVVWNLCKCVRGAFAASAVQCKLSPWCRHLLQAHFRALYSPARCCMLVPAELSRYNLWNLHSRGCSRSGSVQKWLPEHKPFTVPGLVAVSKSVWDKCSVIFHACVLHLRQGAERDLFMCKYGILQDWAAMPEAVLICAAVP